MRTFIIVLRNIKTEVEFNFEYSPPKPSVAPIEAVYVALDKFPGCEIVEVQEKLFNAKLIEKHGQFKQLQGYIFVAANFQYIYWIVFPLTKQFLVRPKISMMR